MLYWKLHTSVAGDCDVDTEIKTDNVHYTKSSQNMLYWKLHISVAGDCDVDTEIKTDNVTHKVITEHVVLEASHLCCWRL